MSDGLVTCGFTGHKFSYCDCEVPTPLELNIQQLALAKVDALEENIERAFLTIHGEFCNSSQPCSCDKEKAEAKMLSNALRAVVELHKPHPACSDGCGVAGWCEECMEPPYPCKTIQAIEKEMK